MCSLFLPSLLLLLSLTGDRGPVNSYTNYRLEKLCNQDGSKVELRLSDMAASFHLNSSLVPGRLFSCHLELILQSEKSGFFVHFDSMKLAEATEGDCKTDYVQFGRDFLFITSHRSNKFCGAIERQLALDPPSANNRSQTDRREGEGSGAPPLSHRVYTEESDQEMDLWLQLAVPALDWPGHKTVSLTVTPFRKSCSPADRRYRHCSINERHCIQRDLFCDGHVNCENNTDEIDCKKTAKLSVADRPAWHDFGPLHYAGLFLCLLFIGSLIFYTKKQLQHKSNQSRLSRNGKPSSEDHASRAPSRARRNPPALPPSYSYSMGQQSETIPQYSYNNR